MFTHKEIKVIRPFAKTDHDETGHYYITNNKKRYPSITTVLKLLDTKEWYPHWVASVARKEGITEAEAEIRCKEIGEESMKVGTQLHMLSECHIHNNKMAIGVPYKSSEIDIDELFKPLAEHLDEHVNIIQGTESQIYSHDLQLAGTADLIAEYDKVPSIIDYKNSRKPKSKSECNKKDYFIQLCAYGKMWEFCTGQKIEQGVVIVVSWDGKVKSHIVKLADYEDALMTKLVLVEQQQALNTMN